MDRQQLLRLAQCFADEPGTCLFYSGQAGVSHLCLFPLETVSVHGYQEGHPWELLKEKMHLKPDGMPLQWVGYLSYEMGFCSDAEFQMESTFLPEAYFYRPACVLSLCHATGTVKTSFASGWQTLPEPQREWCYRLQDVASFELPPLQSVKSDLKPINHLDSFETYSSKIRALQEAIGSGDIYQANLSHQMRFTGRSHPFSLFHQLVALNPAPYSAYFHLPHMHIVCNSPERFLLKQGNQLVTEPIKGTAPRGRDAEEDEQYKAELLASEKEKAELLMITDLLRNDLGRVSEAGSVAVERLWHCEQFANVFHLLSTISSTAKPNQHPLDIIRACFPGGSITGCPKIRAIQMIHEVEQRQRGVYTGSLGYITGDGDFQFNIAIRTIVIKGKQVDVQLGGGIVYDSEPIKEYEETFHKGKSIFILFDVI